MNLRSIEAGDVKDVCEFWKKNNKTSKRDSPQRIKEFIGLNNGISLLAEDDGDIVGTVLGSYDGRKGYIQKVVVRKDYRGFGLGEKLVRKTLAGIIKKGALDIRVNCAEELVGFYKKCGFKVKNGIIPMQIRKY